MFVIDAWLNKRFHKLFTRHFIFCSLGMISLILLCYFIPFINFQYYEPNGGNPVLKVLAALLLFDAFVYFVHRYVEHGIFWRWHKSHHRMVDDNDLTYYCPSPVEKEETLYYAGIQMLIAAVLGLSPLEMFVFITWVFQQGGYVHQKGLPELPWPLLSCKHHRNHHFQPKTYYGGLFLFWDKTDDIDPRAIKGFQGRSILERQ
jgi:sterol desaturase/sphingolipid hydroxylase (fatty acid hydroxylase superfamily)